MQAATAPLLLLAFRVDQYAQWILVTAICGYLSLALNGPFYALLNEITRAAAAGDRATAARLYATGLMAVGALLAAALVPLDASFALGPDASGALALPLCLGLALQAIGFAAILFDAGFRAADRYALGTNILTLGRVLEWVGAIGLAFLVRDVAATFAGLVLLRMLLTLTCAAWLATRPHGLAPIWAAPSRRDLDRLAAAARGQVLVSATNAASVMGPQIVVASLYDAATVVTVATARTYLRLLAAGANVLTAAAWPVLGAMAARGDRAGMRALVSGLLKRTVAVAITAGLAMIALAGPVFSLVFHGNVEPDRAMMLPILLSTIAGCATAIAQSVFVATNLPSRALPACLLVTLAQLAFMAATSRVLPLAVILAGAVAFDLAVFALLHRAVAGVLSDGTAPAAR